MIHFEEVGITSVYFSSMLEFFKYESDSEYHKRKMESYLSYCMAGDKIGHWNNNGHDVINHATFGDERAEKIMMKKAESLYSGFSKDSQQVVKKVIRKKIRSDFGDEYDIHKAYQGQVNQAWTKNVRVEEDVTHHLVTLVIDIGANWSVDFDRTLWTGGVVMKIVEEAQLAGKSVKVIAASVGRKAFVYDHNTLSCGIVIKDYNEELSSARLAGMLHLGFFRTVMFSMMFAGHKKELQDGLGSHAGITLHNIPYQIREEIDAGHTKAILIKSALSMTDARMSINSAYDQMHSEG